MLVAAFTAQTGIKVRVHTGEGPEIAAQILQEGADSPADVFFTENSPELILLDEKGLLAPVAPATLKQIPPQYNATDGSWLGVLARENVLAYNPALIKQSALPASLFDLAAPAWKNRIAIAPSDGDFLPLVSAVIAQYGQAKAASWLDGLKANALIYQDDESVVAAVDRGAVATGIINNYYWARLETAQGAAKTASKIYHFRDGDIGGLINVSGAAVLKSSPNQAEAQKFLAFLVSPAAQTALGQSEVDYEYPLLPGIPTKMPDCCCNRPVCFNATRLPTARPVGGRRPGGRFCAAAGRRDAGERHRRRDGHGFRPARTQPGGSIAGEHLDPDRLRRHLLRYHRHRVGMVCRTHGRALAPGMGCIDGRAARDSGIHHQLRLGLAQPGLAGFRGRSAGHHAVLLSAGLSAGRGGFAGDGPGAGGDRAVLGQ
jgi:iron(III) transport system substrate-binding protein